MLDLKEMQELQCTLQERYRGWWEPVDPAHGRNKLLWMLAETGEAIQVIKKKGDDRIMTEPEVRAEFTEELCDMLMFLNDVFLCYGITPDEMEAVYRAKHDRNMTRWQR